MAETTGALDRLRPMRVGLTMAVLSILLGFGLGGAMGGFEDGFKDYLKSKAETVKDSVYHGKTSSMKKVTKKSWSYIKRAHMHGGGIGAAALALILLLGYFDHVKPLLRGLTASALGAGALGYSSYWLCTALAAPSMGGIGLAKDSLEWLAVSSAGLALAGLATSLGLLIWEIYIPRRARR